MIHCSSVAQNIRDRRFTYFYFTNTADISSFPQTRCYNATAHRGIVMLHRFVVLLIGLFTAISLSGCATWVNIPPHAGDAAIHDPNEETVRHVEAAALRAALADKPADQDVQIVLPPGTLPLTYDTILPRISPSAMWSSRGISEGMTVVEVKEIRIRGSQAAVDVIRPWDYKVPESGRQLMTVDLGWDPVSKWQVKRVVSWHTSVEKALQKRPNGPVEIQR